MAYQLNLTESEIQILANASLNWVLSAKLDVLRAIAPDEKKQAEAVYQATLTLATELNAMTVKPVQPEGYIDESLRPTKKQSYQQILTWMLTHLQCLPKHTNTRRLQVLMKTFNAHLKDINVGKHTMEIDDDLFIEILDYSGESVGECFLGAKFIE